MENPTPPPSPRWSDQKGEHLVQHTEPNEIHIVTFSRPRVVLSPETGRAIAEAQRTAVYGEQEDV